MILAGRAALPEAWVSERLKVTCWKIEFRDTALRAETARAVTAMLTPAVLAGLPPDFEPESDIESWMSARIVESAVYSVRKGGDGRFLGLLMLAEAGQTTGRADIHLGYLFSEQDWGHGYASEALSGCLEAIEPRGCWRLLGGVAKDNPASARVLRKAGFERDSALSTTETDIYIRLVG